VDVLAIPAVYPCKLFCGVCTSLSIPKRRSIRSQRLL